MVTYHGATVILRFEKLTAETMILKEYLGLLSGGGVDQVFYTKNFPITTGAGATTDVESNVNVYTRVAGAATWVTLSNASEADFAILGASGTVTIKAAKNAGGDAGKAVSIDYFTCVPVSRGQGATVNFDRDVLVVSELGNPAPVELITGHNHVSGNIDVLYCDRNMFGKVLGQADWYNTLPDFSFHIAPNGWTSGQPDIKVTNAKFYSGALKATLKGLMALNVKFEGLLATVTTVP